MNKSMDIQLTGTEARVLGALIEKDITTPEYYPLSLNALVNACNQKTNREPVMELDEDTVREAVYALERLKVPGRARPSAGGVAELRQEVARLREEFEKLVG